MAAVQFNNQSMLMTAKVRDIVSYRQLAPELDADKGPIPENPPELALSIGHFPPHPACAIENYWIGRRFSPHHSNYTAPVERYLASGAGDAARIALDASALTRPTT